MKIHHIGYLVKKMERTAADFEKLGFTYEDLSGEENNQNIFYPIKDPIRKVRIVFMKNDAYRIELIEPDGKDSPVYGLLKQYRNSPYHICYSTSDMETDIHILEKSGWMLFDPPTPAPAIHNRQAAFLMSANSGMLELIEETES